MFGVAILLGPDGADRSRFLSFYTSPDFRVTKDRGELIVNLIRGNEDKTPRGTHRLLYSLATDALDLPPSAFTIKLNWVWASELAP